MDERTKISIETQNSLSTQRARNLATTTKTIPKMLGITPRWFLQLLPWIQVSSGTYRVNKRERRLERAKVNIIMEGKEPKVLPEDLKAIPLLRNVDDRALEIFSSCLSLEKAKVEETVVKEDSKDCKFYIIIDGIVERLSSEGKTIETIGKGDHFGCISTIENLQRTTSLKALTDCTFLSLERAKFESSLKKASPLLFSHFEGIVKERAERRALYNDVGERTVEVLAGELGEPIIPETYVEYEEFPREYSLNLIQTILRINTRVADIYNDPIDQTREQLRLAIESILERQEWELFHNKDFGLLHNVAPQMRIQSRSGVPTPDDMDELLTRVWKKPAFFLAHPKAIAAFGRECTKRGVPPPTVRMFGASFLTWRGVPFIPTDKIPVGGKQQSHEAAGKTQILLVRLGDKEQGVVGLHQAGPSQTLPSLHVRKMGIDVRGITSYLISLYFSLAVQVDDALGMLDNVEVSEYYDYSNRDFVQSKK